MEHFSVRPVTHVCLIAKQVTYLSAFTLDDAFKLAALRADPNREFPGYLSILLKLRRGDIFHNHANTSMTPISQFSSAVLTLKRYEFLLFMEHHTKIELRKVVKLYIVGCLYLFMSLVAKCQVPTKCPKVLGS